MKKQTSNALLMIEPVAFGFNLQTAENNYFQQAGNQPASVIQEEALNEFKRMTDTLKAKGVDVILVKDTPEPHTPDSIFPNNWISFHCDGSIALYPMFAENRRLERRMAVLESIEKEGFSIHNTFDYSPSEKKGIFLEGTGSMVLDRVNQKAYAALSERTNRDLFMKFCQDFRYTPFCFSAYQTVGTQRLPIYHTNVMMCISDSYAVVCTDSIDDPTERQSLVRSLKENRKEIIIISEEQMHQFAGNMLPIENKERKKFLVMSESAYQALNEPQINRLSAYNEIIRIAIPTIEKQGGGSVRCMMAEIFLPKINSNEHNTIACAGTDGVGRSIRCT
ncbi:MAG: amidinotransferase [Dysgonamonadaceae bacterium]|jgi:hypothetical protein|nr:amidinotransferase [Dysgonamonadaceae bacterium]